MDIKPIWLIAPIVSIVWLLVIYYLKDAYPFGNGTPVSYDWYNGTFASLLHNYDAWHSGNLFYDFTSAAGFARNVLTTVFQPQNLFALLWEREDLVDAMSILVLLKFAAVAFTSSYCFSKLFPKVSDIWILCASLMYTFCGFNIQYYTNIDWMDIAALFPLLVLFTLNMFKGKGKIPYFTVLAYMLISNTYMTFFVFLALIVFGGLYIFLVEEKSNRRTAVYNLGIGSVAALLAGMPSVLKFVSTVLSTQRVEAYSSAEESSGGMGDVGYYFDILGNENEIDIVSVFMFLGMAIGAASLIVLWFRFKSNRESRKYTVFFSISLLLFVLQIVFMGVMLLWHAGSYQNFPFRNGYMAAFLCICILLYYQQTFGEAEGINFKRPILNLVPFLPCFFIGIGIAAYAQVFYFSLERNYKVLADFVDMQTGALSYPYTCFALLLIAGFVAIKFIHYKKVRTFLSVAMVAVVLFLNFNNVIAIMRPEVSDPRAENSIYELEFDIKDNVRENDPLSRVSNTDVTRLPNYGYFAGVSTLSNWTHTLTTSQIKAVVDLGYTNSYTLIIDGGGTAFSDALLRITESFADAELDEGLYEKYATSYLDINYYKNRFSLPVGVVCDGDLDEISADNYQNTFEYQNAIYESMTDDEELFKVLTDYDLENTYATETYIGGKDSENENSSQSSDGELLELERQVCTSTFTFDIEDENVLYFAYKDSDKKPKINEICVNGQPINVYNKTEEQHNMTVESKNSADEDEPSYNTAFPVYYNNNVLELGVFEDETVTVSVEFENDEGSSDSVIFSSMSTEKMEKLCAQYGENSYSVEKDVVSFSAVGNDETDFAFVPLGYSENWECTVNGKTVEPICVLENFIAIPIEAGKNEIVLSYSHSAGITEFLEIILLFIVGMIILLVERKIKIPKVIYNITFGVFILLWTGGMLALYVVPVGYSVITEIIGLIK